MGASSTFTGTGRAQLPNAPQRDIANPFPRRQLHGNGTWSASERAARDRQEKTLAYLARFLNDVVSVPSTEARRLHTGRSKPGRRLRSRGR